MAGVIDALDFSVENHATVRSGSLACIRPHPGSFDVVGVREKLQRLC
jgi:hypothetical protein